MVFDSAESPTGLILQNYLLGDIIQIMKTKIISIVIIIIAGVGIWFLFQGKKQDTGVLVTTETGGNQSSESSTTGTQVTTGEKEVRPVTGLVPGSESIIKNRVPTKPICVGEYCDGSMSGDDYKEKYTVLQIPLTTDGGNLGCGAKLFFAPHAVPKTTAVLDATYRLLFDLKPTPEISADGFRNVVGAYTQLWYDRVTLVDGVAKLYLTGTMRGPGHCAEPELRAQIDQSALQFPTVQKLEVYLNGKVFDWCTMGDADPSESGCDKTPKYWINSK